MGSFNQLLGFFSDDLAVPGAWFHIPEREIYKRDSKHFANKDGLRPCLLGSLPGPNQLVYTRSASLSAGGIAHSLHVHGESQGKCAISRNGWIIKAPVIVDSAVLVGENFSCLDPDGPTVLARLLSWGGSR